MYKTQGLSFPVIITCIYDPPRWSARTRSTNPPSSAVGPAEEALRHVNNVKISLSAETRSLNIGAKTL